MSYHRRYKLKDNRFGLLALTLREKVGLTQAEVASVLAVSERTIRHWEGGTAYPSTANLKDLIELYLRKGVFAHGQERDEAKAFWEQAIESASRRKSLFDEEWFNSLLEQRQAQPREVAPSTADWGEATDVASFYGREQELATLQQWVLDEHCRVVVLLGMGGIGKTTLSIRFAQAMTPYFDFVLWRSLRNGPPLEELLADCIHILSKQQDVALPAHLEKKFVLLIDLLRKQRCLLVLDNLETLLQAGSLEGRYRDGYEAYATLIQRVAETAHQSCLLLTSREMLTELEPLEGPRTAVRALKLFGLNLIESQRLLCNKGLFGTQEDWGYLVQHYSGNPLALKIAAATIHELFGGDIAAFVREGPVIPHTIQQHLAYQLARLSPLERDVMYWLAIERDLISYEELCTDLALTSAMEKRELLMTLQSLRRRCLVERGEQGAVFTLQPVVMEYVSERLVEQACEEIMYGSPVLLLTHALMKAQSKVYIRDSQVRMLIQPVLKKLVTHFMSEQEVEQQLLFLLRHLQEKPRVAQGYGGGNLLNLLVHLKGHLKQVDCSALVIRQAYLQGVEAQDANFAGAQIVDSLLMEPIESIASVALSPNGQYLAVGSFSGQIRVWQVADGKLLLNLKGHNRAAWSLAFDPTSCLLATGGYDGRLKLWQIVEERSREISGQCLKVLQAHDGWIRSMTFSTDGTLLVTGSDDETVRVWDVQTGTCQNILRGHVGMIWCVALSPDGTRLVTGGDDETVRVWDVQTGACLHVLHGHTGTILSLAFHPTANLFASGDEEGHINIWNTSSGHDCNTLQVHTRRAASLAFNPEGTRLACGSYDGTVEVWQFEVGSLPRRLRTLQGHSLWVSAVTFGPGGLLASTSYNGNVRLWNVEKGRCLSTFQGYSSVISALAFSPDGHMLVHGDDNGILKIWQIDQAGQSRCLNTFRGHKGRIWSVAFSPDGRFFATGGDDPVVKLWQTSKESGQTRCLKMFPGHTTMIWSVTFSPDGKLLASCGFDHTIKLWAIDEDHHEGPVKSFYGHTTFVWSLAFSPDGRKLASGDNDGKIKLWDVPSSSCLTTLLNSSSAVGTLAFSSDGSMLLSNSSHETVTLWDLEKAGHSYYKLVESQFHVNWAKSTAFNQHGTMLAIGDDSHTVKIWQLEGQQRTVNLKTFSRGGGQVWSVAFSPDNRLLASGDDDGTLAIWEIETGTCLQLLRSDRPYERMNIYGLKGITEAQKTSLKALGAVEKMP
jgi:WD40 repeat protein/transcriptional regulator with XRE-family HTH domain